MWALREVQLAVTAPPQYITQNVRTIESVPLGLAGSGIPPLEVRGEVYIAKSTFAELNREAGEVGSICEPRNAAAEALLPDPDLLRKESSPCLAIQWV